MEREEPNDECHGQQYPEHAVAIIGVACRFSGADSVEQLWNILSTGSSQCTELPKDRFPDRCFERRNYKQHFKANVMKDVDAFDHKFFKVSKREAGFRDPQQRMALEVTYQALESAGYFARETSAEEWDMGCYMATSNNEYHENVCTHAPSAFSLTGSIRPFIAGQVSHYFGMTGPSIMFDAACAASGVAVNTACRAVASGECKSAVVGATNLFVTPDTFQNLAYGHFTSPTGPSKTFDAAADGYGRGEGVAAIVIKKLSDAIEDGDVIRGVISATAVNQCANGGSITVPHGASQSKLYRKALQRARLDADQIGYIEAHGTGTRVGDPIEVESIRAVFGDSDRGSDRMIYMGSLKSNIGHVEATAGLSGLIKAMLIIEKGVIPQQALFNTLNPQIAPLEPSGLSIPVRNVTWPSKHRSICVNNYGASGSNAVMILTQPPVPASKKTVRRIHDYPVSITAFSETSLKAYCSALLRFIDESNATNDLALDVAFHLSRKRNPELPFSIHSSISDLKGLRRLLSSVEAGEFQHCPDSPKAVVLFFPGQDGRSPSISRALYDSCQIFRTHIDDCDMALRTLGSQSMFPGIFESRALEDNRGLVHAKLFSVQYASAKAWIDCGLKPDRLVGHSFGQLTALAVAGVLSLQDALRLVVGRARVIDEKWDADPGAMLAIEASRDDVAELLQQNSGLMLEMACYNGERSFVVAGTTSSINSIENVLRKSTLRFKRLQTSNAFHSVLAQPLVRPIQGIVENLSILTPSIPLETCSEHQSWSPIDPPSIASHIREPVFFHQAVQRIADQLGPSTWIEAGCGTHASLLRRALEPHASLHEIKSIKLDADNSLSRLADVTAELWKLNAKVQFWPFHRIQRHDYQVLNIPPYQFDKPRHWMERKETALQPAAQSNPTEPTPFMTLMQKSSTSCTFKIDTSSERWQEISAENRVLGISTCSVSSCLHLVREAVCQFEARAVQQVGIKIQHMEMLLPIPVAINDNIILEIRREDTPRSWVFAFSSASNQPRKYTTGTVCTDDLVDLRNFKRFERLVDTSRIREVERDPNSDRIRGRGLYKICAETFQIPTSRQIVQEVAIRGSEATASLLSLPENAFVAIEILLQIPSICLNGMLECPDDEVHITTTIGDAQFRAPSPSKGLASAYVKFFELASAKPTCDIYVFDAQDGKLAAIILDVSFARISTKTLGRAVAETATSLELPAIDDQGVVNCPDVSHGDSQPRCRPSEIAVHDAASLPLDRSSGLPNLTESVYDLLARVADVDVRKLRPDISLADMGIDSLMLMEVTDEINKEFAVDMDMTEFLVAEDLGSVCQLIANQAVGYMYDSNSSSGSHSSTPRSSVDTEASSHTEMSTSQQQTSDILTAAHRAFDEIRADFDVMAKSAGCDRFYSDIHPVQTRLLEAYVLEAFEMLGCNVKSIKPGSKFPNIPHKAGTEKLLDRLMGVLRDTGLVAKSGLDWHRTEKSMPVDAASSAQIFQRIQREFPKWAPEHELLHVAGNNLAAHLQGATNPVKVFFGTPERRKLMADQYLVAPIQSTLSRQLASFIEKCFSSGMADNTLRVLEVGGGTCGTTLPVLDAFVKAGVRIEYTFTDISPAFITAAKAKLNDYGFVKYRALDISAEPPADVCGQYHVVLATNVIHATPDAGRSARNVRKLLREDGFFAMVEYTCMYAAGDVIFGQFDGWWAFDDGRTHAIMNEHEWEATLKCAGYTSIDWTGSASQESHIARIFLAH